MALSILVHLTSGVVDLCDFHSTGESLVRQNTLTIVDGGIDKDFKPTRGTATWTAVHSPALMSALLAEESRPVVEILEDGVAVFTGLLRPTDRYKFSNTIDTTEMGAVDFNDLLDQRVGQDLAFDGVVVRAGGGLDSIVHRLIGMLSGPVSVFISAVSNTTPVPLFECRSDERIGDVLAALLPEYGMMYRFGATGTLVVSKLPPSAVTGVFGDGNDQLHIEDESLEWRRNDVVEDSVELKYRQVFSQAASIRFNASDLEWPMDDEGVGILQKTLTLDNLEVSNAVIHRQENWIVSGEIDGQWRLPSGGERYRKKSFRVVAGDISDVFASEYATVDATKDQASLYLHSQGIPETWVPNPNLRKLRLTADVTYTIDRKPKLVVGPREVFRRVSSRFIVADDVAAEYAARLHYGLSGWTFSWRSVEKKPVGTVWGIQSARDGVYASVIITGRRKSRGVQTYEYTGVKYGDLAIDPSVVPDANVSNPAMYRIECDSAFVNRDSSGAAIPSMVTFLATRSAGSGPFVEFFGTIKVHEASDGKSWSQVAVASNTDRISWHPTPSAVAMAAELWSDHGEYLCQTQVGVGVSLADIAGFVSKNVPVFIGAFAVDPDPATCADGSWYYNTTSHQIKAVNEGVWSPDDDPAKFAVAAPTILAVENEALGGNDKAIAMVGSIVGTNAFFDAVASRTMDITGTITANSGRIAGFTIQGTDLVAGAGDTRIGMSAGGLTPAFWAGSDIPAGAPFQVSKDGFLRATKGQIAGWTLLSATLTGGLTTLAADGRIWAGHPSFESAPFSVDSSGAIKAESGVVGGWSISPGLLRAQLMSLDSVGRIWAGHTTFHLAPFSVDSSGAVKAESGVIGGFSLTASSLYASGVSIAASGDIALGTGNNLVRLSATDAGARLWVGNQVANLAPFRVSFGGILTATGATINGDLTATTLTANTSGTIAGWKITSTALQSGDAGAARIVLDKSLMRVAVENSSGPATVMGYLSGLLKNGSPWSPTKAYAIGDLVNFGGVTYKAKAASFGQTPPNATYWAVSTDAWTASEYGFWAKQGQYLRIDGDVQISNGDWIIARDSSYLIKQGAAVVARMGMRNGDNGLYINEENAGSNYRSWMTSSGFYVGNDSAYLKFEGGALSLLLTSFKVSTSMTSVKGSLEVSADGTMSALVNQLTLTADATSASIAHSTRIDLDVNTQVTGGLTVIPGTANSWSEGIRIAKAGNGFSSVVFAADPEQTSGAAAGESWSAGRRGLASNGASVGDFSFTKAASSGKVNHIVLGLVGDSGQTTSPHTLLIGSRADSWGAGAPSSRIVPTIWGSAGYFMMMAPHVPFMSGNDAGSRIRFEGGYGTSVPWDIGIGTNPGNTTSVGVSDQFSIGRNNKAFVTISSGGTVTLNKGGGAFTRFHGAMNNDGWVSAVFSNPLNSVEGYMGMRGNSPNSDELWTSVGGYYAQGWSGYSASRYIVYTILDSVTGSFKVGGFPGLGQGGTNFDRFRLFPDGTALFKHLNESGTVDANGVVIGGASFSWHGSVGRPTIYSQDDDRWVMIVNPHIPFLRSGARGHVGRSSGAGISMEEDATPSAATWRMGIGVTSGTANLWEIARESARLVSVSPSGDMTVAGNVNASNIGHRVTANNLGGSWSGAFPSLGTLNETSIVFGTAAGPCGPPANHRGFFYQSGGGVTCLNGANAPATGWFFCIYTRIA